MPDAFPPPMLIYESILPHLPGFLLVLTRFTGLFLFTPLLTPTLIPRQVLVLFAAAMALAVYPTIDHSASLPERLDLFSLAPMMASEILIGAAIGLIASIPLITAQLAGLIMGQQMGLGLATVFNPAVNIEGDNLGQLLFTIAVAAFLVSGGLESLFSTLVSTFASVPLGGFPLSSAPLPLLVDVLASGFEVALRVAMPILVILFMENIATGFIMKTIPALNIMAFGFPIKILAGLAVIIGALTIMAETFVAAMSLDLESIQEWAWSLAP